LGDFSQVRLVQ